MRRDKFFFDWHPALGCRIDRGLHGWLRNNPTYFLTSRTISSPMLDALKLQCIESHRICAYDLTNKSSRDLVRGSAHWAQPASAKVVGLCRVHRCAQHPEATLYDLYNLRSTSPTFTSDASTNL